MQVMMFQNDTEKYTETLSAAFEAQKQKDSDLKRGAQEKRQTEERIEDLQSLIRMLRSSEALLDQQVVLVIILNS